MARLVPSLSLLFPDILLQVDYAQGWTSLCREDALCEQKSPSEAEGLPFLSPPGDRSCLGSSVDDSSSGSAT